MRICVILAILFTSVATVWADEPPNAEQLKKMYDQAMAQLQDAQQRKSELAKENETLTAKVAEMQKELDARQAKLDEAEARAAQLSDLTWQFRSTKGAWETFLKRHPELLAKWRLFVEAEMLDPIDWNAVLDGEG